ncbi:uncharacterized protein ASPGLDRAFT_63369 [Aspergillus glaucus CBS 516.65]|uniref:ATP-grasp domain-containing protein n=1 Tax=Aspergillus glaucus CBS 516.65 TaxID=1160497 RepID=A0A1L9VX86_ASPGL|nr:hypothetical protein ASPGLDRAFT_63369 [Aspergillus glaucus CBS 516.65]OJJ88497.1 hypothetical protein ASPGLDRAFT_63369 [Aspergillus glaucus CBS 516.65]
MRKPGTVDANIHKENRDRYASKLKIWPSSWPNGSFDSTCPHPVQLHEALYLAIEDIIGRWWTDDGARFPEQMPLEPEEEEEEEEEENFLCNKLIRPYKECQGFWRPDFLLEHDADLGIENFRICEINARFCWNGYMHTAFGQEAYSAFEQRGLVDAADPGTILRGLLGQFDRRRPLHIVKGNERGIDSHMFVEFCQLLGIKAQLITPDSLRVVPHREGHNGYKLYSELKRQISLRYFNDMRAILLTHDKRMRGIVLQELNSLVTRNILSAEQAAQLEQLIDQSRSPEQLKDDYILKPIRSGKGDGIQFGDQLSHADWLAKLEELRDTQLKPGLTLYVVRHKVNQRLYDVTLGSGQSVPCHKVGTYHAVNGQFVGLGA